MFLAQSHTPTTAPTPVAAEIPPAEGYADSFEVFSQYDPANQFDRSREGPAIERMFRSLERASQQEDEKATLALINRNKFAERAEPHSPGVSVMIMLNVVAPVTTAQSDWKHLEVVAVRPSGNSADSRVVYLYGHADEQHHGSEWRFWISRQDDKWLIDDWERLDQGMPRSKLLGLLAAGSDQTEMWSHISGAIRALKRGDIEEGKASLSLAESCEAPPGLHDLLWLIISKTWRELGAEKQGRWALAQVLDPDSTPGAHFAMMDSLRYSDPLKAAQAGEQYYALIGPSPEMCEDLAIIYQRQGEQEKSLKHWRQLAKISPGHQEALAQLLTHGAPEDQQTVAQQLDAEKDSLDLAVRLAKRVSYLQYEALQFLAQYTAEKDATSTQNMIVQGTLKMYEAEYETAADFYKQALEQATGDEPSNNLLENYLIAMAHAGKALQGYRQAEDKQEAFETIVWLYEDDYDMLSSAEYAELVREHRAAFPKDAQAATLAAELAISQGHVQQAKQIIEEGLLGDSEDEYLSKALLRQLLRVQSRLGNVSELYDDDRFGDEQTRFIMFGNHAANNERYDDLAQLLKRPDKPDHPLVHYFFGVLAIKFEKWQEARRRFAMAYEELPEGERPWTLKSQYFKSLLKTDLWKSFYLKASDQQAVYAELADFFLSGEHWTAFGRLTEIHRRSHPEDPNLAAKEKEVAWLRRDYAAYARLASAELQATPEETSIYVLERLRDRLFTAYQKSGQIAKAQALAVKHRESDPGRRWLAVLAALKGDYEKATSLALTAIHHEHGATELYTMPEYGRLFLNPAFASLQEEYPVRRFDTMVSNEDVAKFYLNQPLKLTDEKIRTVLENLELSTAETSPFAIVSENAVGFVIQLESGMLVLASRSGRHPSDHVVDPTQSADVHDAMEQSTGSFAASFVSWGIVDPSDDDMQAARGLIAQLLGDRATVLYDGQRWELHAFTADNQAEWISGKWPTDETPGAIELENPPEESRPRAFFQDLRAASATMAEAAPLEVRIRIGDYLPMDEMLSEKIWVEVDSQTRIHGGYRYRGKLKTASTLIPELYSGLPVTIHHSNVTGWRQGDEERLLPAP